MSVRMVLDSNGNPIQVVSPVGDHERLDGSGGATASAGTFDEGTIVRLYSGDTGVYVSFKEDAATGATAASFPLSPNEPEYFSIHGDGVVISVIEGEVDINVCK